MQHMSSDSHNTQPPPVNSFNDELQWLPVHLNTWSSLKG